MRTTSLIRRCIGRVDQFGNSFLRRMETIRPTIVHEKAHVYPVSVPELWQRCGQEVLDWNVSCDKALRLYVHIPWCLSRCTFCFYESRAGLPDDKEVRQYIKCLEEELKIYAKRLGKERFLAETLYIGGGTPSILAPRQIELLLTTIDKYVTFVDGASQIVEASPGTLTSEKLQALIANGINRISIGMQSFDDAILRVCGRDHDSKAAIQAYKLTRQAGIREVNFDLMLALPNQTHESFAQSVNTALQLGPSSISFLDLRVAPGSPLHKSANYYPSWLDDIYMRAIYQELMKADGRYERTRPHYYILPEQARARSTRVPCLDSRRGPGFQLGLGVTSYSHLGNICYINWTNPEYGRLILKRQLPIEWALTLGEDDMAAMLAIRAIVDKTLVPDTPEIAARYSSEVAFLRENGLIDGDCQLTDDGCLFGEEIAYMFYPSKSKSAVLAPTQAQPHVA